MAAGSANKVVVDVELRAQLDSMKSGVKELEGLFKNLNLNPQKSGNMTQIFTEMKKELGEIEALTDGNKIKGAAFGTLEKKVEKVSQLYNKLGKEISSLDEKTGKDLQKLFPPEIGNAINLANSKLKEYEKILNQINSEDGGLNKQKKDLKEAERDYEKLTEKIERLQETLKRSQSGEIKLVSKTEIENTRKEIEDLTNKIEEYKQKVADAEAIPMNKTNNKAGGRTQAWKDAQEDIKKYNELIEQCKQKIQELQTSYNSMQVGSEPQINKELQKTQEEADKAKQVMTELKTSIQNLESENPGKAFEQIKKELQSIEGLKLDWTKITNIEEFQQALAGKTTAEIEKIRQKIQEMSSKSQNLGQPFRDMTEEVQRARGALNDAASSMKQIEQLAQRGLYFFGLTNQVNLFKRAVQSAFETVKELDKSMTETAVVTDFSVGDMWKQLPQYTQIANQYNATLKDAYDVMTLYYQQGLETNQVFAVGEQTMKMARIAGLEYAEATDRMTNALRGFNMEINTTNSERVADVYSQLAAMSASDVDELSNAMTKTASLANSANMQFESTAAFLAQIIETTRESAETAGTALKTVIARFSEVKDLYSKGELLGNIEGEEIDVNKVGKALRAAGVDLNEFLVGAKGLDEIFIELADRWDSLDLLTQRYIATMAAGSRQQSRFIALMSNNERLTELLNGAYNAAGESSDQFAKTQESLESKLNNLKNAWDAFLMGIANSDIIKGAVDLLTGLITTVNKVLDVFGKLGSIPKTLASIGLIVGVMKAGSLAIGKFAEKAVSLVGTFGQTNKAASESIGIFTALSQRINNLKLGKGFATDLQVMQNQIKIAEQSVNVLGETISKPVGEAGAVIAFKQTAKGSIEAATAVDTAGNKVTFTLDEISKDAMLTGAALKDGLAEGIKIGTIQAEAYLENLDAQIEATKARMADLKATGGGFDLNTKAGRKGAWKAYQQSKIDLDNLEGVKNNVTQKLAENGTKAGENLGNRFSQGFNKIFNSESAGITGTIGKVLEKIGRKGIGTGKALGEGITAGVEGSVSGVGLTGAAAGAAYVAAALAVIAILGVAIYKIWYNATDQASKNMVAIQQSALSELQKETDALSSSVSDLKNNWDSLGDQKSHLDELTQGTAEWYAEVAKLNAEVLKLVNQYSGLDNKLQIESKDGILSIDPESYQKASEELTEDLNKMNAQTMIMSGLTNYNQAKLDTKAELDGYIEQEALKTMQGETGFKTKWGSIIAASLANAPSETAPGEAGYIKSYFDYEAEAKNSETVRDYAEFVIEPELKAARENARDQVAQGLQYANKDLDESAAKIVADQLVAPIDEKASESQLSKEMRDIVENNSGVWGAGGKKINGYFDINNKYVQDWIKANNYTQLGNQIINPETGETIDLKDEKTTNAIVAFGANQNIQKKAKQRARVIEGALDKNKINDQLAQILTGDATVDLSGGVNIAGLANLTPEEINALLGVESGGTLEQLQEKLFGNIQTIIADQKNNSNDFAKDLATNLLTSDINTDTLNSLTKVLSDKTATEQAQIAEQFNKVVQLGNQEALNAYVNILSNENVDLNKIDTSSLAAFRNSLMETGQTAEDVGISMSDAFKDFISSGALDSISEDLDELIEANGRITPDNIKELAKSSKELAAQLGYTEEEWEELARGEYEATEAEEDFANKAAIGLAHVITAVRDGRIEWTELTSAIVAAASATRTQADALAELKGFTENFEVGTSQLIGREFYSSNAESMEKLAEQGAWGDSTFEQYLDTVFRDFNPETNADVKKAYNTAQKWESSPGSFWREMGLSTDSSWLEDKTTDEAIAEIIRVAKDNGKVDITEEYANARLQEFLAGTTKGRKILEENDIEKSIEEIKSSFNATGQQSLSDAEVETLAKLNNVSANTMLDYLEKNEVRVTDNNKILYDEEGNKRKTITYDNIKEAVGEDANFTELNKALEDVDGSTRQAEINIDKLTTALSNLGVNAEAQQAYIESLEKSGKKFTKEIRVWDADLNEGQGGWTTESVTGTYKEVQDQIEERKTVADWKGLASEISKALGEVDININGDNVATVLEESVKKANTTLEDNQKKQLGDSISGPAKTGVEQGITAAKVEISSDQVVALQNSIRSAITNMTPIPAPITYSTFNVPTYSPNQNGETQSGPKVGTPLPKPKPIKTSGPLYSRHARGGSTRTETALVGEEGPELIQIESGGAYLAGAQGPEMIKLHQGDIVYPNDETKEIYRRGGLFNSLPRYAEGTGPYYNRYETSETVDGSHPVEKDEKEDESNKKTEENTKATEANTKATQELANIEREQSRLDKQLSELKEGGVWTAPWQLANLQKQKNLLKEEQRVQEDILEQKKKEAKELKDANSATIDKYTYRNVDGSYGYTTEAQEAIDSGALSGDELQGLQDFISKTNEVADQQDTLDDAKYKWDELSDEQEDIIGEQIDTGVNAINTVIDGMGKVASAAVQMIEAVAQAMVDGFKSFLGWLTIRIDDEHDIGELDESLKNRKELLDWEYEKIAEKNFDYSTGLNSKSQENLFENIDDAAQNVLIRLQNQRRLYENSFRQLEDLGTNINSDIECALEDLYDALYGIDGVFTKVNDRVQYLEQRFEQTMKWNLTKIREWDPIETLNEHLQTKIQDDITKALDPLKLFDNTLIDKFFKKSFEQIAQLEITEYRVGDMGESLLQKVANFFYELSPKFDADYQIVNKSELVDALKQKMETIITNGTITSQFVNNYLDYLTEIESQMEDEVSNIRGAESEILNLYDEMTEILEKGKDEYNELAQDLYDAIVSEKESIKEELEELNSNITDGDSDLINILKANLDQIRQQRENDKTEQDLMDKEARLAYLKQDTSGANKQEILKLEKELKEGQQSYTDKLIDQKISELEKQNEEAATQRQVQIDLLQEEINNSKKIWEQVYALMDGLLNWDHLLLGEIDRDAYYAVMEQLKKGKDYQDSSDYSKEDTENTWQALIRKASLYGTMKTDRYKDIYANLQTIKDVLDNDTKLMSDHAQDGMWNNYVAFTNLETAVKDNTSAVKKAVNVINSIVNAKTLSFDETGSIFTKATNSGGQIQALSGLEYAATKLAEDVSSGLPGILTQVTTGIGNLMKGSLRFAGALADSAAGMMTGDIALGDVGDGIGKVVEGMSNLFAAGCDAAALFCQIVGDTAPGFTDMGVAAGTMIANWIDNAFEEVNDHLIENVDRIKDEMYGEIIDGRRYGGQWENTGRTIRDQKEALRMYMADNNSGNRSTKEIVDFVDELYAGIEQQYAEIDNLIKTLDENDIEGINKQYARFHALQKVLERIGHTENVETYLGRTINSIEKWAGETGSIFAEMSEREVKLVVAAINEALLPIIQEETIANGDPKTDIWESNLKFRERDIKYYNDIYKELLDNSYYSVDAIDEVISVLNSIYLDTEEGEYTSPSAQLLIEKLEQLLPKRADQMAQTERTIWETFLGKMEDGWGEFGNKILQLQDKFKSGLNSLIEKLTSWFGEGSAWANFFSIITTPFRNFLHANGYASGGSIGHTQNALTGELGPELVQHANGTATIVGRNGPEISKLRKGDQVYTAQQTQKILKGAKGMTFNRFAEGTVGTFMTRDPFNYGLIGNLNVNYNALGDASQSSKENSFNFNLSLEGLTVDSIERVEEVADRVWDKLNTTVRSAMWPYNTL